MEKQRTKRVVQGLLVLLGMAAVTFADLQTEPAVDSALFYFFPVILACLWFDLWGLLSVPLALWLYHWVELQELPRIHYGNDLVKLLSFLLIAYLTLVARYRYRKMQAAEEEQIALRQDAEHRRLRLESLYRVATAANTSLGANEFLKLFLKEVTRMVAHIRAAVVMERRGDLLVRLAAFGPLPSAARHAQQPLTVGIVGHALAAKKPVLWYGQIGSEAHGNRSRKKEGLSVNIGVPLLQKGEASGVLILYGEPGSRFSADDLRTLQPMASEAALVLSSLRLYDDLRRTNQDLSARQRALNEQLSLAREVQNAILASSPACRDVCRLGPVEVASHHETVWDVGGDILRIVPESNGITLFMGDVMGKGVPAALLMTMLTALLGNPTAPSSQADAVLSEVNQVLARIVSVELAAFVTVFYAYLSFTDLHLRYASAGHPPALLVHADGSSDFLYSEGPPLGILSTPHYMSKEQALRAGDRLVIYTDGVTEARNERRELFGEERLREVVIAQRTASAGALQEAIVAAVRQFTGSRPLADDLAVLVAAVHGGETPDHSSK